jgi:hypothetical protein
MKNLIVAVQMALLSAYLILIPLYSFAQAPDEGTDPAVAGIQGRHINNFYSGPIPYIILGVVMLFLAYVGYRYYSDHSAELDSDINSND